MTKEQPGDVPTNGDGTLYNQTELWQTNPNTVVTTTVLARNIFLVYSGFIYDYYRHFNYLPLCQGNPWGLQVTY